MTTKQHSFFTSPAAPYTALVLAMILWGGSFVALKVSFRYFHPLFVVFMRQLLASIVFIPLVWKHFKKIRKQDLKWLILMSLFEPCIYYIFEANALTLTSASQAGMVTSLLPVLVAIPSALFLKERISKKTIIGFTLAIIGVIFLSLTGQATEESPNPVFGNFLEFLAMISAAGYTVILKKLSTRYSPFFLTAVQAFIGTVFFAPVLLFIPESREMILTTQSILVVVFLGVVVTIGAYGFYNFGTSKIPASQSAAFINLIPIITIILSMILLRESLAPLQYAAAALVIFGVIFSQDRTKEEVPVY
ncbi:MAG: DMT family transporter [Spirochaetaceae bacterium]|nr:DMT family transporter [Spirochaetaceae bacterium]